MLELPPDRVIRTIEIDTPEGVMRGKLAIPAGPTRLAGLVPAACELTNAIVQYACGLAARAGEAISCQAGCGACCRHVVPVSPPEAFHIMNVIESYEPSQRADVLRRFERIDTVLEQEGMIAELLNPPPTDAPVLPIARKYFELKMPCPFLVEESCSIHARRPVGCRDFNVTSPAEWCASPYENDIAKVPTPIPFSAALSRMTANLVAIDACLIPLTLVPRWTREYAELGEREWPGTELFDLLIDELSDQVRCVESGQ